MARSTHSGAGETAQWLGALSGAREMAQWARSTHSEAGEMVLWLGTLTVGLERRLVG